LTDDSGVKYPITDLIKKLNFIERETLSSRDPYISTLPTVGGFRDWVLEIIPNREDKALADAVKIVNKGLGARVSRAARRFTDLFWRK
jgi:hypothetical protein